MSEPVLVAKTSSFGLLPALVRSVKFSFVSYAISVILLAVLALILVYTPFPESYSPLCIKGIIVFSAFLTSLLSSLGISCKGWICGIISGLVNVLILLLAGMAVFGADISAAMSAKLMLMGACSGLVGGVIGVNFSQS